MVPLVGAETAKVSVSLLESVALTLPVRVAKLSSAAVSVKVLPLVCVVAENVGAALVTGGGGWTAGAGTGLKGVPSLSVVPWAWSTNRYGDRMVSPRLNTAKPSL